MRNFKISDLFTIVLKYKRGRVKQKKPGTLHIYLCIKINSYVLIENIF
jgi:hypothetical protein